MAVLVSGSDLSDFFSDRLNDKSDDVSRISRGLRQKKIRSSLPLLFSKIISGKHIKEEKKYECKNAKGYDELCGEWKEVCQEDVVLMQTYCKKTCGFCVEKPAPAPPACQLTDHGCCWDGVSTAHGPNQEGCPECLKNKYSSLCMRFQDYCLLEGKNREWIRQKCPKTCINLWKKYAEKTFPAEELQENVVYNAWEICYSGAKGVKRGLESLLDQLETTK